MATVEREMHAGTRSYRSYNFNFEGAKKHSSTTPATAVATPRFGRDEVRMVHGNKAAIIERYFVAGKRNSG